MPQVLLMENVPMVHSADNMPDFKKWIEFLEGKGYSNWWQDLNSRNYGVAQNRDRTFMVSILGEWHYKFPQPIPLTKTMKDYLEEEVDEKYYINNEKAQKLIDTLLENGTIPRAEQSRAEQSRLALTLPSTSQEQSTQQIASRQDMMQESVTSRQMEAVLSKVNELGFIENGTGKHQSNTVYGTDGICPCEYSVQHKEPFKILE